jgi:O-antigen/teichoic acid export membrane protein
MIIPAIVGMVLIRILTSIFTHEEYGYYNIVLTTIGLIKVFSVVWLSQSVIRFYVLYKNNKQESTFLTTLLFCSITNTFVIALLALLINIIFFRSKISPELYGLMNLGIPASVFMSLFETLIMIYRASLRPKKYSFYWICYVVIKHLVGLFLIYFAGMRVEGIYWAFIVIPIFMFSSIFIDLQLYKNIKISHLSLQLFHEFKKYGIPLALSNLSYWLLSLSDRYLLEFFRNSSEVGLYSVGYSISEKTIQFSYLFLILAATPIIVDNWERYGRESTQALIKELTRYYFLLLTPILIIFIVLPEQIFLIFADKDFIHGAKVLPFISFGTFLLGLSQYIVKGFELAKKSNYIAFIALFAGIINIVLNIIFIPHFGYFGASVSCFIAYLIYVICATVFVKKFLPWHIPFHSIARIAGTSIFIGLGLFVIKTVMTLHVFSFILISLFSVIIFYILLFLLGEIRSDEIKKLTSLLKKNNKIKNDYVNRL